MFVRSLADFFHSRLIPILGVLLLVFLCGLAVFIFRKPIIVVSDTAFEILYGEGRASISRIELSILAFRPVRLALVSENAAPFSAAEVAMSVAGPRGAACVLLPTRYRAGAEILLRRLPGTPIVLVGESDPEVSRGAMISFGPDRATDLYRAGLLSGKLAAGQPLVLRIDGLRDSNLKEPFIQGVAESGCKESPSFLNPGEPLSAAVASSFVTNAAYAQDEAPCAIIFSWADPSLLPQEIKVVFDDSLYALSFDAFRAGIRRVSGESPSAVRVLSRGAVPILRLIDVQAAILSRRH
ncbi:MAG: hypothetical protein WCT14_15840 [Treponemataceae bacterium]